jgi:hypothetical protein
METATNQPDPEPETPPDPTPPPKPEPETSRELSPWQGMLAAQTEMLLTISETLRELTEHLTATESQESQGTAEPTESQESQSDQDDDGGDEAQKVTADIPEPETVRSQKPGALRRFLLGE